MTNKNITLIKAFTCLWEQADKCALSKDFFEQAKPMALFIRRKLGLKAKEDRLVMECTILSILIDADEAFTSKRIAEFLGCSNIQLLVYYDIFEELHDLRMIRNILCRRRMEDQIGFSIEPEFVMAVKQNRRYTPRDYAVMSAKEVLRKIHTELEIADRNAEYYGDMLREINVLLNRTQHTVFSKKMNDLGLANGEKVLFLIAASYLVFRRLDCIGRPHYEDILMLCENVDDICEGINNGTGNLARLNLLENVNSGGIKEIDSFCLTNHAINTFLAEMGVKPNSCKNPLSQNLIKPELIIPKSLYYNEEEGRQIQRLSDLLQPERFAEVQKRLTESGKASGICALLHGVAGGGKTESVYQLARQSGRAIYMVDAASLKSCFVGESEKLVKGLFDQYDALVREYQDRGENVPILLFNECDAVMGKRMKGAERAVEKMENAVQNIILQAMENFKGIMIATSNLADSNLDNAFSRRFLIKVNFKKPEPKVKSMIWQTMLPDLSDGEALQLSEKFDFSGGEIDNVTRKLAIDQILYDKQFSFEHVVEVCREEGALLNKSRSIGFC